MRQNGSKTVDNRRCIPKLFPTGCHTSSPMSFTAWACISEVTLDAKESKPPLIVSAPCVWIVCLMWDSIIKLDSHLKFLLGWFQDHLQPPPPELLFHMLNPWLGSDYLWVVYNSMQKVYCNLWHQQSPPAETPSTCPLNCPLNHSLNLKAYVGHAYFEYLWPYATWLYSFAYLK